MFEFNLDKNMAVAQLNDSLYVYIRRRIIEEGARLLREDKYERLCCKPNHNKIIIPQVSRQLVLYIYRFASLAGHPGGRKSTSLTIKMHTGPHFQ